MTTTKTSDQPLAAQPLEDESHGTSARQREQVTTSLNAANLYEQADHTIGLWKGDTEDDILCSVVRSSRTTHPDPEDLIIPTSNPSSVLHPCRLPADQSVRALPRLRHDPFHVPLADLIV